MSRKKIVVAVLVGAAVAGVAIYFLKTADGKQELKRLKETGKATADTFKALGEEIERNVNQARKEERNRAVKSFVKQVWEEA